ncbi:hypothetical protein MMC32_005528 [Xylographa parallela]|nr:hypothetical protein [Xylographa parallela]
MSLGLSLEQFSAELLAGFKQWADQGQPHAVTFREWIKFIMDKHESQRTLCKEIFEDLEMVRHGHTGVPVQYRNRAQIALAARLKEAKVLLHGLEIHLGCARRVKLLLDRKGSNYGRTAGVDGLVTAMIQGFGDFRGKKHLFTKTWDEISQL